MTFPHSLPRTSIVPPSVEIEYGFGYTIVSRIRPPYTPYSLYIRGTITFARLRKHGKDMAPDRRASISLNVPRVLALPRQCHELLLSGLYRKHPKTIKNKDSLNS